MPLPPNPISRRDFLLVAATGLTSWLLLKPRQIQYDSPTTMSGEITGITTNQVRAQQAYLSLVRNFSVQGTRHFHEYSGIRNREMYACYLWPYLGVVSATLALGRMHGRGEYYHPSIPSLVEGIEAYYDGKSNPRGYDSYLVARGGGQKYYDDNEWLGLVLLDAYQLLGDRQYLLRAAEVFRFVASGWSDDMGGGIYWRVGDRDTKNTCSNGPAAVMALQLFQATQDPSYLAWGEKIMAWLGRLKSPDGLYWDNVHRSGQIDRSYFSYNVATPLHANALLYQITGEPQYLQEARSLATASYNHLAQDRGSGERIFPNTPWFNLVLLRSYIALYEADPNKNLFFLKAFRRNLDSAWENARADDSLIHPDWSGKSGRQQASAYLLDQTAMVESYALISHYDALLES